MATTRELEIAAYEPVLIERSGNCCEMCGSTENLSIYDVPPETELNADHCALLCNICKQQVTGESELNSNHWYCLNDCAWSMVPAVQALSYRMLNKLEIEDWIQNLLEQIYLDDETREWADAGIETVAAVVTKDSNGARINSGDSVTIIKDLPVKGTGFVAKRGTVVKGVRIPSDGVHEGTHVEGKVNGTSIYIKTEFIKAV